MMKIVLYLIYIRPLVFEFHATLGEVSLLGFSSLCQTLLTAKSVQLVRTVFFISDAVISDAERNCHQKFDEAVVKIPTGNLASLVTNTDASEGGGFTTFCSCHILTTKSLHVWNPQWMP